MKNKLPEIKKLFVDLPNMAEAEAAWGVARSVYLNSKHAKEMKALHKKECQSCNKRSGGVYSGKVTG